MTTEMYQKNPSAFWQGCSDKNDLYCKYLLLRCKGAKKILYKWFIGTDIIREIWVCVYFSEQRKWRLTRKYASFMCYLLQKMLKLLRFFFLKKYLGKYLSAVLDFEWKWAHVIKFWIRIHKIWSHVE